MKRIGAVVGLAIGAAFTFLIWLKPPIDLWLWRKGLEEAALCEATMTAQGSHCADPTYHQRRWGR